MPQKGIFPGILVASVLLVLLSLWIPRPASASNGAPENSNSSECSLSSSYPEAIRRWCTWIENSGQQNSVDPSLVAAVMLQESGGTADAYSHSGAVGLLQVMPRDGIASDFMCLNGPCFASRPTIDELMDPEFNISYGSAMLAGLIQKHGNLRDALFAYGPMDVGYTYADHVLSIYQNYR